MKRNLQRIKNVLRDPNKKPLSTIIKEVLQLWVIKKEFPLYYFGRFFYRKGAQNPKNFMNTGEYNTIVKHMVIEHEKTAAISNIMDNKLMFYLHCKTYGIPTPEVLSYNFENKFYYKNQLTQLHTSNDLKDFLNILFKDTNQATLFLKPFDANSGKGAMKIHQNNLNMDLLWDTLSNKNYIHQNVVVQHPQINKIYAKSINTLRLETFTDKKGGFNFLGRYMRFGSGGSHVDNVNQGGFYVNIDFENESLVKYAETNLVLGAKILDKHPDTDTPFENFKIPFFKEAIELVKKASLYFPTYIQAWDVVITPEGPILLEGNNFPSMITGEYSYGGYKNKPAIFKELLEPR